jgi:hypothetical protein
MSTLALIIVILCIAKISSELSNIIVIAVVGTLLFYYLHGHVNFSLKDELEDVERILRFTFTELRKITQETLQGIDGCSQTIAGEMIQVIKDLGPRVKVYPLNDQQYMVQTIGMRPLTTNSWQVCFPSYQELSRELGLEALHNAVTNKVSEVKQKGRLRIKKALNVAINDQELLHNLQRLNHNWKKGQGNIAKTNDVIGLLFEHPRDMSVFGSEIDILLPFIKDQDGIDYNHKAALSVFTRTWR